MARGVAEDRLVLANYSLQMSIDTQYGDLDVNGHVNNISVARFYESVRAKAHLIMFDNPRFFIAPEFTTLLAEYQIKFLQECHYPEPVIAALNINRAGNSSYGFEQALFQNDQCIGICDVAMVLAQNGKPCRIPDAVRERMLTLMVTS